MDPAIEMTKSPGEPTPTPLEPPSLSRVKFALNLLLLLVVFMLILRGPLLQSLGRALIVEDQPAKAEVMVILGGSPAVRGMAAADYYQEGLAPLIFICRGQLEQASLLGGLRTDDTGDWGLTRRILASRGVPDSALVMDSAHADNTLEEAYRVKDFLDAKGAKSLILVTSRYHSRRAVMAMRHVLGEDINIISLPSKYDPFDPAHWWSRPADAKRAVLEFQKIAYYYFKFLAE